MDLKQINDEIRSLPIAVCDAASHRRLSSLQKRHRKLAQPVASLQIPNRLFVLWSKKLSLPRCLGCNSIFKRSALVNSSLQEGTVLASTAALEFRLQKSISNTVNKIKRLKKGSRTKLEKATTHFAVYQEDVISCNIIDDTTAEITAVSTSISEETTTFEVSGKQKVHIH